MTIDLPGAPGRGTDFPGLRPRPIHDLPPPGEPPPARRPRPAPALLSRVRKVLPVAALATGACLTVAGAVPAGAETTLQRLKPYCMSDYLRLCDPSSDTNRARVVACFKRNVASVSARCRRAIDTHTRYGARTSGRRRP